MTDALLPGRAHEGPPLTGARVLVFRCPQCRHQPSLITEVRDGLLVLACEQCRHTWRREDRRGGAERRRTQQSVARERREAERRRFFPGRQATGIAGDRGEADSGAHTEAASAGATFGSSIYINGTISADEDVVLDGRVDGTVSVPGHTVTIGENGQISASVDARNVVVYGRVRGNITAAGRISLKAGAHVEGDLVSRLLAVADGALFNGRVHRPAEAERKGVSTPAP